MTTRLTIIHVQCTCTVKKNNIHTKMYMYNVQFHGLPKQVKWVEFLHVFAGVVFADQSLWI